MKTNHILAAIKVAAAVVLILLIATLISLAGFYKYLQLVQSRSLGTAVAYIVAALAAMLIAAAIWWITRVCRRHIFRFELRSMLIAIAILSIVLSIALPQVRKKIYLSDLRAAYEQAQAVITKHDGIMGVSSPSALARPLTPEEILIPDETYLWQVTFHTKNFNDFELASLAKHPNLQVITFDNCTFTREGILELAKLQTLKVIDLRAQAIDAEWVKDFSGLRPDCVLREK